MRWPSKGWTIWKIFLFKSSNLTEELNRCMPNNLVKCDLSRVIFTIYWHFVFNSRSFVIEIEFMHGPPCTEALDLGRTEDDVCLCASSLFSAYWPVVSSTWRMPQNVQVVAEWCAVAAVIISRFYEPMPIVTKLLQLIDLTVMYLLCWLIFRSYTVRAPS